MFIKLPSGRIFRIDLIVSCGWDTEENNALRVTTTESDDVWLLRGEDAKRLYEYLESIAIV